jgi:hypothetical protein
VAFGFLGKLSRSLPLRTIPSEYATIILETLTVTKPFKNVSGFYEKKRACHWAPLLGEMNSTTSFKKHQKTQLNLAVLSIAEYCRHRKQQFKLGSKVVKREGTDMYGQRVLVCIERVLVYIEGGYWYIERVLLYIERGYWYT